MQKSEPTLMFSASSRTDESNRPASCLAFFSAGAA